jgi:CheY-like chemotaxis protein
VILLDLHLPDMFGIDVLRELRAHEETAGVPLVVMTADATAGTRRRAEAEGADAFLPKPLDVALFLKTLDDVLAPA